MESQGPLALPPFELRDPMTQACEKDGVLQWHWAGVRGWPWKVEIRSQPCPGIFRGRTRRPCPHPPRSCIRDEAWFYFCPQVI